VRDEHSDSIPKGAGPAGQPSHISTVDVLALRHLLQCDGGDGGTMAKKDAASKRAYSTTRKRKRRRTFRAFRLPVLVKPDGAGYMPLYCAAQWIATRGGTLKIKPWREAPWREAFKDLLDRIASEDVKVVGVRERDGATETVSGIHFASCSVNYPFSALRSDLVHSKELCLFSRPYLDDEHWRRGLGDSLEDRGRVRWRRLMVLKADVARYWPFAIAASVTGGGNEPPAHTPAARPTRKQPLRERARRALDELYADGVPDQTSKSDAELVRAVEAQIRKSGQPPVSHDTILRAAGRRK
jgi:hypothetical protein